jgi:hypothetical protein
MKRQLIPHRNPSKSCQQPAGRVQQQYQHCPYMCPCNLLSTRTNRGPGCCWRQQLPQHNTTRHRNMHHMATTLLRDSSQYCSSKPATAGTTTAALPLQDCCCKELNEWSGVCVCVCVLMMSAAKRAVTVLIKPYVPPFRRCKVSRLHLHPGTRLCSSLSARAHVRSHMRVLQLLGNDVLDGFCG